MLRASPNDLAQQFLELLRLREKVYELERQQANDRQHGGGAGPGLAESEK